MSSCDSQDGKMRKIMREAVKEEKDINQKSKINLIVDNSEERESCSANDYFPDINQRPAASPVLKVSNISLNMKKGSRNNQIKSEPVVYRTDNSQNEEAKSSLFFQMTELGKCLS